MISGLYVFLRHAYTPKTYVRFRGQKYFSGWIKNLLDTTHVDTTKINPLAPVTIVTLFFQNGWRPEMASATISLFVYSRMLP